MRRAAVRGLSFLALVALLASAAGQEVAPVLVEDLDVDYAPRLVPGTEPVELRWSLFNLDRDTPYFVTVSIPPVPGWDSEPSADKFFLQPLEERNLTVTLRPDGQVPERAEFTVTFNLVSSDTGVVTAIVRDVVLIATEAALVLGVFSNPLPPPLDNVYGVFALEMAFWVLVAVGGMLAGDTIVRLLAARAPGETVRSMIRRLRQPVFLIILALGLRASMRVLPTLGAARALSTVLDLAVIGVGAYVGYQVLSALLDYYSGTIAARTATKIDDVLVPIFRKIGAVVVVIVALALMFQRLGLNANVIFGAAGIAGLVIAFAAQDTLSNFFSGMFLLLDRPFAEGDDIQIETGEIVRVENVGLRSTRLYHYRNHETIVLPNNQLASRRVVTLSSPDRHFRVRIDVPVARGSDPVKVMAVLERVGKSHPDVLASEQFPVSVRFDGFGDSSLNFFLQVYVRDGGVVDRIRARVPTELRVAIVEALRAEGVEIPLPHRTLILKGEAGAASPAAP